MSKPSKAPIQVHLRLDDALDARLKRVLEKHPSLRTRTARIAFAVDVGLEKIVGPVGMERGEP